jgi:hypothetical protein
MSDAASNEEIIGMALSDEECDEAMFRFVRKDWRDYECDLFTSKWFDYRYLNPVKATYLYAHEFKKVYRRFFRKTIDYRGAEAVRPLKRDDLFECPQALISAIWRGRQHADAMGIPYDLYIDFAMEACLRFWKRPHLPRPAQLYSGEVCEFVQKKWEDHQQGFLHVGDHYSFRVQHYVGTPAQDDHHEWLMNQATKRSNSFMSLKGMFDGDLLPIAKIEARFGHEVSQRILEAA